MDISEIKEKLSILTVLSHYGIQPDKNKRIRCPFHEDKTPSMQVYPNTNTVFCFSSNCQLNGKAIDAIDFIMHKDKSTKHEALKKAASLIGTVTTPPIKPIPPEEPKKQKNLTEKLVLSLTEVPALSLDEVFKKLQNNIGKSAAAQAYIQSRNLDITKLEIGYNATGYRDLKHCIVFALRDKNNKVVGLYGRSIYNNDDEKHFYLKDSTGLYPRYPNPDRDKLIIVESIIDTASLLQIAAVTKEYGLLSAYGTNRLNDEMKAAIVAWAGSEVIFAFDNDKAGNAATLKYAEELKELMPHIRISKLNLPEGEDINSTLVAHNADIFPHLIKERQPYFSIEKKDQQPTQPTPNLSTLNLPTLNSTNPNKLSYTTETAIYSALGGIPKQMDMLKIMLQIENKQGYKSRNRIDLYEDKQVEKICKEVSEKRQLRKDLVEQDIYRFTELLEQYRETEQGENKGEHQKAEAPAYFTQQEKTALEAFLKQPNVIKRINQLLGKTGIVGEERNRIFLLLIAISYKMKEPLHSLVQGSSGSGKTKIVRQVSDCIPTESVTRFTRISDKALYNYPKNYFTNRLLIIEDVDGLSEDAEMAFRELQSSGELRSSVSIKLENGQITGGEKIVKGPIASMSCTTKGELYEDNMSRVFLIAVDESKEQTRRIITYQNQKASGKIISKEEQQTKHYLQKIIRMIVPNEVINPYAEKIQLPEESHKIRRLNDLFHNFIKMVTLTHQYQRKRTAQGAFLSEIEDIEIAMEIMFESIVLKVDELDGSLRQFFEKLKLFIQKKSKNYEFNRFEIREATGVGKTQQHHYINKLVEMEYIRQNGFANRGFTYKINYWDNYTALRERIKTHLQNQISIIKGEHQPNANRTPKTK